MIYEPPDSVLCQQRSLNSLNSYEACFQTLIITCYIQNKCWNVLTLQIHNRIQSGHKKWNNIKKICYLFSFDYNSYCHVIVSAGIKLSPEFGNQASLYLLTDHVFILTPIIWKLVHHFHKYFVTICFCLRTQHTALQFCSIPWGSSAGYATEFSGSGASHQECTEDKTLSRRAVQELWKLNRILYIIWQCLRSYYIAK